jgi:hypothetical protein
MDTAAVAASQGRRSAVERGSYVVKPWVLYQSADPLRAERAQPGIDAVIVETPYERVRFESFLQTMQGTPLATAALARLRETAARHYGFIVYSHSRDGDDRDFLSRIGNASIAFGTGRTLAPVDVERFGPANDFYSVGDFRELRWTGSVTFRFTASTPCAAIGTFRFTDGYGRAYAYPFDFTRYK